MLHGISAGVDRPQRTSNFRNIQKIWNYVNKSDLQDVSYTHTHTFARQSKIFLFISALGDTDFRLNENDNTTQGSRNMFSFDFLSPTLNFRFYSSFSQTN